jgi:uroporphyrinogen decarboxylase
MIIAEGRLDELNARYSKNVSIFIKLIFKMLDFDKNHLLFIFLGI